MSKKIINILLITISVFSIYSYCSSDRAALVDNTSEYIETLEDGTEEPYIYEGDELSDKYKQTLRAQPQEELTEEQINNGWILYDGHAYPPNQLEGEAGDFIRGEGDVNPNYCGYVTFTANVAPSIKSSVYIEIIDIETFEHYAYILDPINSYKTPTRVPVGTFIIYEGSPLDDYSGRYAVSQSYFTVKKGENTSVTVFIADREEQFNKYKDKTEDSLVDQVLTDTQEQEKDSAGINIKMIIFAAILIIVIVIGIIKKIKEKKDK